MEEEFKGISSVAYLRTTIDEALCSPIMVNKWNIEHMNKHFNEHYFVSLMLNLKSYMKHSFLLGLAGAYLVGKVKRNSKTIHFLPRYYRWPIRFGGFALPWLLLPFINFKSYLLPLLEMNDLTKFTRDAMQEYNKLQIAKTAKSAKPATPPQ